MPDKVVQYLAKQKRDAKSPEVAKIFQTLVPNYVQKLWQQLTIEVKKAISDPSFKAEVDLKEFYDNFIAEFEIRINAYQLVEIAMPIAKQIFEKNPIEAFHFLSSIEKTVKRDKQASICIWSGQIELHLLNKDKNGKCANIVAVRDLIESTQKVLDELSEVTPVHAIFYKISSIYLREIVNYSKELESQLNELRRHKVYRFWTEDGKGLYTGQSTVENDRVTDHLNGEGAFGKKLKTMLDENKKVYIATIKDELTELEANDLECLLIFADKNDETNDVCCNEVNGRFGKRFLKLSSEERESKIQEAVTLAANGFQTLTPDMLIHKDNVQKYKVPQIKNKICRICQTFFSSTGIFTACYNCSYAVKLGDCLRAKCPKKNIGIDEMGYCRSCHLGFVKAEKENVEQKEFNPSHSRVNNNYDNQLQKALAYSMFKSNVSSDRDALSKIILIFGINLARTSVQGWWAKFNEKKDKKPTFDADALKKFLTVKKQATLSIDSINALIKYEYTRKQTAENAAIRISTLFNVSLKNPVTLQQVQGKFEELELQKTGSKRKAEDETSSSDSKKSKIK